MVDPSFRGRETRRRYKHPPRSVQSRSRLRPTAAVRPPAASGMVSHLTVVSPPPLSSEERADAADDRAEFVGERPGSGPERLAQPNGEPAIHQEPVDLAKIARVA